MNEMIRKHTETSVNEDDTKINLKAGGWTTNDPRRAAVRQFYSKF